MAARFFRKLEIDTSFLIVLFLASIMIASFESIRGVAALIVALYHLNIGAAYLPFIKNGYLFVDLFFVLSGFIMYAAYASKLNAADDLRSFLIRRVGRLLPLLLFSTLAFVLIDNAIVFAKRLATSYGYASILNNPAALEYDFPSFSEALATLTFTHAMGIFDRLILNTPSWSISVEFYTYVLFMLICFLVKGQARLVAFVLLSALGFAASIWASASFHDCLDAGGCLSLTYDFGFVRSVHAFFLGALAYYASRKLHGNSAVFQIAAVAVLIALIGIVDSFPAASFAFPAAFTLLILSICSDSGPLFRILKLRPFQILGQRSYSIYLMHVPLLLVFENASKRVTGFFSNLAVLVLFMIVLIIVSGLTYRFIEDPLRRAFNQYAGRPRKLFADLAS